MFLISYLVFSNVISSNLAAKTDSYDEVAEFKEILKEEIPLVVLFTEECCSCTDCVEAEVLLGGMSQELEHNLGVQVVRLKKPDLRPRYGVKSVPSIVFIRNKKPALYDGRFESDEIYMWLQENREPATVELSDDSFEHLTQAASGATTGDWLVLFHDDSCCKKEFVHLENAGIKLRNRVNVATVNINKHDETAKRFKVSSCPVILFFRHTKMYRFGLPDVTATTLRRFAEGFYKNSKAETVPLPCSSFYKVILKAHDFYIDHWYTILVMLAITTVSTTTLLICVVVKSFAKKKRE